MNIKRKTKIFKSAFIHLKLTYLLSATAILIVLLIFGINFIKFKRMCINGACIRVEVVSCEQARQKGLMSRKSLGPNNGMFFVFTKEDYHGFWMKNMEFPLDIIWIGPDKKIVDIYHNALPCRDNTCNIILPRYPAIFVLELNAGFVRTHGINIGDKVSF